MSESAAKTPTILIIDDDSEIRYSLSRVLSSRKYQVLEAASGEGVAEFVEDDAGEGQQGIGDAPRQAQPAGVGRGVPAFPSDVAEQEEKGDVDREPDAGDAEQAN